MKCRILLMVLMTILVPAVISGPPKCQSRNKPTCNEAKHAGHGGANCSVIDGWYYYDRLKRCIKMRYKGCGGNGNFYCNRNDCRDFCETPKNNRNKQVKAFSEEDMFKADENVYLIPKITLEFQFKTLNEPEDSKEIQN